MARKSESRIHACTLRKSSVYKRIRKISKKGYCYVAKIINIAKVIRLFGFLLDSGAPAIHALADVFRLTNKATVKFTAALFCKQQEEAIALL